ARVTLLLAELYTCPSSEGLTLPVTCVRESIFVPAFAPIVFNRYNTIAARSNSMDVLKHIESCSIACRDLHGCVNLFESRAVELSSLLIMTNLSGSMIK